MKKLSFTDIKNLYEYEKIRNEFRARIMELKRDRRIEVGRQVSFIFENRDTVTFQVQEMIRAERIVEDRKVQEEIEVYNQLLPDAHELSATLLIEITEPEAIRPQLDRFQGLDREECVYFEFDGLARVPARFEAGHSKEDRISAVQYVRFRFTPEERAWFADPRVSVALVVAHPNYAERTVLHAAQRASLARDFEDASIAAGRRDEK